MLHLLLTIDTEGDNLWASEERHTYSNVHALDRFQAFCDDLHLKPTYLVAHEVLSDDRSSRTIADLHTSGRCEIGAHLHAWLTPPAYPALESPGRQPYLHEYPEELKAAKLETVTQLLEQVVGERPTSYRGGRWSLDAFTLRQLDQMGYIADTTVTPFVSWVRRRGAIAGGPNFAFAPHLPYHPSPEDPCRKGELSILEVPTSDRPAISATAPAYRTLGRLFGNERSAWLVARRMLLNWFSPVIHANPATTPADKLCGLARRIASEYPAVLNLAFHSSELFPGGAPWVRDETDARRVWDCIRQTVSALSEIADWESMTLSDYVRQSPAGASNAARAASQESPSEG